MPGELPQIALVDGPTLHSRTRGSSYTSRARPTRLGGAPRPAPGGGSPALSSPDSGRTLSVQGSLSLEGRRGMGQMARRIVSIQVAALLTLALVPAAFAAGGKVGPPVPAVDPPPPPDAVIGDFVTSTGALGAYWDGARNEFALVYSDSTPRPSASLLAGLAMATRTETTSVTAQDVATAKAGLAKLDATGALDGNSWSVYFDPRQGVVVVSGSGDPATVGGILGLLGAKGQFQTEPKDSERLDRLDDLPPFWGGGQIRSVQPPYIYTCTAGFAVQNGSRKYMLTAGHCFQAGWNVTTPTGTAYGSVAIRAVYPSRDMELISGQTYGGDIYTGTRYGLGIVVNATGANPVSGVTYCSGGSKSYEKCDKVSIANDVYHCFPTGCTDKLTTFTNGNELIGGDSGGPYYYKSSQAYARGILIGLSGSTGYAQEWNEIAQWFNITPCHYDPC